MSQVKNDNNPLGALWNSVTKEGVRIGSEMRRHVTESIGEVAKGVTEGGLVGGLVTAADKFSAGSIAAGMVDSFMPGEDLPKPIAEGIAGSVNGNVNGNVAGNVNGDTGRSAAITPTPVL